MTPRTVTFSGVKYHLRALHVGDETLLQNFFYSHSPQTIRFRYGYPLSLMSAERAHRLVDVVASQEVALGIFSLDDGVEELHAVGRYCCESPGIAEVAFVVRESKRRLGMATELLHELARVAKPRGIVTFRAMVMRENDAMRRLLLRLSPDVRAACEGNTVEYLLDVFALSDPTGGSHRVPASPAE